MNQISPLQKRLFLYASPLLLLTLYSFLPEVHFTQHIVSALGWYLLCAHLIVVLISVGLLSLQASRKSIIVLLSSLHLVCALSYLPIIFPFYSVGALLSKDVSAAEKSTAALLTANLHAGNRSYEKLSRTISEHSPTIVALVEVDHDRAAWLENQFAALPHRARSRELGVFGTALLSKYPLEEVNTQCLGKDVPSTICAKVIPDGDPPFHVIVFHPPPPASSSHVAEYSLMYDRLTELVSDLGSDRLLVVGDFNATPFSTNYKKLVARTGLKNASHEFGMRRTWNTHFFFERLMLDHILLGKGVKRSNFLVLSDIGSDHLPLYLEFSVER